MTRSCRKRGLRKAVSRSLGVTDWDVVVEAEEVEADDDDDEDGAVGHPVPLEADTAERPRPEDEDEAALRFFVVILAKWVLESPSMPISGIIPSGK